MFVVSLFLVLLSSYFLTSYLMKKETKNNLGVIYLFLIAFAQIILTFEVLSLISAINEVGILTTNIVFLIFSLVFWIKKNKPIYIPLFWSEISAIKKALKKDKLLNILSYCFIIFLISQLLVIIFYPITFGDAFAYYFTRCTNWIQQENLTHFLTYDVRENHMAINMDILYTWYLLFFKNEQGVSIFPYFAYLGATHVIYNFLGELGFCRRKRLWTVFVFSSFALIGVMSYTPSSDLAVGTLVLTTIYLFYIYLKRNNFITLFFSTLALGLAVGTKVTGIFVIPSLFTIFLLLTLKYRKEELKKITLLFTGLFFLNFLLFSSFNFILNLYEFSSPFSSESNYLMHQFRGGFKGYLYNLISYFFGIFDMSGIRGIEVYNNFITNLLPKIYSIFGVSGALYASSFFPYNLSFTSSMTTSSCMMGALGLFAFFPSLINSIYKKIKYSSSNKSYMLFLLSIAFVLNVLLFSRIMLFSTYNFRYFTAFIIISVPICVYSYIKKNNFLKIILFILVFTYLLLISTNKSISFYLGYKNFKKVNPVIKTPYKAFVSNPREEIKIFNYFREKNSGKIALFLGGHDVAGYDVEKLRLFGWHIDKLLLENIEDYPLEKYDYIVTNKQSLTSSKILRYDSNIESPYSYCIYLNYKGNQIVKNSEERPVQVVCSIPYDYFIQKGFFVEKVFKFKMGEFVVLKRG